MRRLHCEVLVVGSGPGGSTSAWMYAESGKDVMLVEEGRNLAVNSSEDHSLQQMDEKWRSGGVTAALGSPKVTYIEGKCVGGASESNAGLYHPPLSDGLEAWARDFQIADFGADELAPHLAAVVQEIGVSKRPFAYSPASQALACGSEAMGWKWTEIERFWRYSQRDDGGWDGHRRSMSETLIPKAIAAGCRLQSDTRVDRLLRRGGRAVGAIAFVRREDGSEEKIQIDFERVVVCAGAVQTPRLLRKSGWIHNIGNSLTMNPMVRIVARFPERVNVPSFGVPVVQIEEFKPTMTIGCSYSAPPHLAMWLEGAADDVRRKLEDWHNLAVFYVKVCGRGRGSVRTMPIFGDSLVRYKTHADDFAHLGEGLFRLASALFAAGATEVHSPLPGMPHLKESSQAERLRRILTPQNSSLSAIHLHSTVPMGENPDVCAADSHGRLFGAENVTVNDSSLLPTSPGVNPQGTILAIARRNILRILDA
ncbi:MAG: oxidoreductase [Deltaproteobacteria bacterium]|nr:oxidoreductase [Deltaproteobacteria bacterium]